ncbi:MAG: phenylacetate--CoA ligase family protein [Desulfobacter sp.]|nr:phenylacetate--CoA ligase family protein [Desulfobacter sp.]
MITTLKRELSLQNQWIPRHKKPLPWTLSLVKNEFASPERQTMQRSARLKVMVEFCLAHVPYYRGVFDALSLGMQAVQDAEDLVKLPILTKEMVQENKGQLLARWLPKGEKLIGEIATSGTTGQPVKAMFTAKSMSMFSILKQRELRWFRFDPQKKFASIRNSHDLPWVNQKRLSPNTTFYGRAWPSVGTHFITGPFLGLSDTTPIEDQVRWLGKNRPDYLLSQPAHLEQLAFAWDKKVLNIKGFEAVSQQVVPQVKNKIQKVFSAPVYQNYGLNEIGIVANQCAEGGRFHVHTEHCWVEIADEKGNLCAPGQRGKILVTSLTNRAMPLIRYDTDDSAVMAQGACPCGRTLPGFINLKGRYRRTALLPQGSWACWDAILNGVSEAPESLCINLRQYQLHQYFDGHFELRLAFKGCPENGFLAYIHNTWQQALGQEPPILRIKTVDQIPKPKSGKYESFTSDFSPHPQ